MQRIGGEITISLHNGVAVEKTEMKKNVAAPFFNVLPIDHVQIIFLSISMMGCAVTGQSFETFDVLSEA